MHKTWGELPEVTGGLFLCLEVPEHPLDLFPFQIECDRDLLHGYMVFIGIEEKIKDLVVKAEVEFLVRDRKAVGIGTRRPHYDLFDHPDVFCQCKDLCLVQVGYRFDVHTAVTILDIEPLGQFRLVRGACNDVIVFLRMVVELDHSYPLLHVLTGGDLQPIASREPCVLFVPVAIHDGDGMEIEPVGFKKVLGKADMELIGFVKFGEERLDDGVSFLIQLQGLQVSRNVDHDRLYPHFLGMFCRIFRAHWIGFPLREDQPKNPFPACGAHAELCNKG